MERILINNINLNDVLSILKDFKNYNSYIIKYIPLLNEKYFDYGIIIRNYNDMSLTLEIYLKDCFNVQKIILSDNKNHLEIC